MEIPKKQSGRPPKYDLSPGEDRRLVPCSKERLPTVRAGYLFRARVTGVAVTTRAVKGGLMVYRVDHDE